MKNQSLQDERILTQRRKINSEAYGIIMIVLLVSILVQQFLLNAPFKQYAVEFICLFGMSIYMIIRYMMLGLNIYGEGKRARSIPLVNSIVAGIVVTVINGVLNYTKYAEHYEDNIGLFIATLAITFIGATAFCFAVLSFLNYLNKKKQEKIQKQLDDEEEQD